MVQQETLGELPAYVDISDPDLTKRQVLRTPADAFSFPLSSEDHRILQILEAKFDEGDEDEKMIGLAAPQIGFSKRAIIIRLTATEEMKRWRPDLTDSILKTIWLNPTYEPIGTETCIDYEACLSVNDRAGEVERFVNIYYTAYLPNGDRVEGKANGFLARLIQHEIDHLNGKLFLDYVNDGDLLTIDEYRTKRAERTGDNS